jgi:hypothetical protein
MALSNFASGFSASVRKAWELAKKTWANINPFESRQQPVRRLVSRQELKNLALNNVCEIVFLRRRPERAPNRPEFRRMLCSLNDNLLNSVDGRLSLNFHYPRTSRRIDEAKHNIVVVWDIFMQDYRNVSMDQCYLLQTIPPNERFWKYYNDVLYPMTPEQKMTFMDTP